MIRKYIDATKKIRKIMDEAGALLTDEQALTIPVLYSIWAVDTEYKMGDRLRYEDVLYKVLMDHTSQETWLPTDAPSLYAKVLTSDTGEILPWKQPDSTNTYKIGDKVTHNGKTWVSTVDNNSWEPGVANTWDEIEA